MVGGWAENWLESGSVFAFHFRSVKHVSKQRDVRRVLLSHIIHHLLCSLPLESPPRPASEVLKTPRDTSLCYIEVSRCCGDHHWLGATPLVKAWTPPVPQCRDIAPGSICPG